MNKRTSIIALTLLIAAAAIFGLLFVNKGDGPVTGMIISDKAIDNTDTYKSMEGSSGQGQYMVTVQEFNKFNDKLNEKIALGKDLYFNVHIVECPKGAKFKAKWISDGKAIKEETKALTTDQGGIISYMLDGSLVLKGSYVFELYSDDKKVFDRSFQIQ